MDDKNLQTQINDLEDSVKNLEQNGETSSQAHKDANEKLDQLWDLKRRREAAANNHETLPEETRAVNTVENYLQ